MLSGYPVETVRGIRPAGGWSPMGLVLGEDRTGEPVGVPVFRPSPTRVFVIGGTRFAVLLGFRALALGAGLSIESAQSARWNVLVRIGMAQDQRSRSRPAALPPRPELIIRDQPGGPPATSARGELAPWSTTMTVRSTFTEADADTLTRADLTLVQPVSPPEAASLAATLGLPPADAAGFTALPRDCVVVLGAGPTRWVRLAPTLIEHHLLGDPTAR